MKYSQIIFKTSKSVNSDLQSTNARLLTQAGYIHQEIAGVYTFLPLGLRVLNKIETIIREEMDKIGVEIYMTSLAPTAKWEQTGRLHTVDVLMRTVGANKKAVEKFDGSYVLGSTHEEIVTPLVQEFAKSYKDLPVAVYQIQTKFRGEPRAKSGLLRCREFRMKDLYSFHTSEADLKAYYERAKEAYWAVIRRLGLADETVIALASGGDFTPDFSHEFQTRAAAGEDTLFRVPSLDLTYNREVAPSQAPKISQNEEMRERKDVEGVGIIGVAELAKFLNISVELTTKTMLWETESGVVATAVRGGYDIDEEKLKKILGCSELRLASAETVERITGAKVGYAGVLGLPRDVQVLFDESTKDRVNFECGANKTNFHSININWGRDIEVPEQFYDFKVAKEGDLYPETGEAYEVFKACEVGNIFPLNTKFSKAFGYTYTDEQGQQQPVYMGCYGIGSSRLMGVLVEKFSDERGIIWPESVAPYQVHLIDLNSRERGQEVYDILSKAGIEVLWDDRDERAGAKFADADLLGIPVRLVVSAKTGEKIEYKKRTEKETMLMSVEEVQKQFQ